MKVVRQYSIIAAVCLLAMLALGAAVAHRSTVPLPRNLPASMAPRQGSVAATKELQLDLRRAVEIEGRLTQRLTDGSRVIYTLDPTLQRWGATLLRDYEVPYGALVAFDLDSGETVLMTGYAHSPEPKPEPVSVQELCLTPWAPAASVFKLISAGALLSLGVPSSTSVCYHGGLRGITTDHLRSNPRMDRDCATLHTAIARSTNPVLARLAIQHMRPELLGSWAERFGFNQRIPFELPVSPSRAEIPDDRLEFARAAAGFWHTDISPLHGAAIAGVALNDGRLRWPHLVRRIEGSQRNPSRSSEAEPREILTRPVARALAQMMEDTVRIGTASRAFRAAGLPPLPQGLRVGGKTGSLSRQNPYLSYSWFVGFAANDRRRIAMSVLIGNPPRWRVKAPTVARRLLSQIFARFAEQATATAQANIPAAHEG
jgi:peptidoglycan glycosyltransferase